MKALPIIVAAIFCSVSAFAQTISGKTFAFKTEGFASKHRAMSQKEGAQPMRLDECVQAAAPNADWNCYYEVSKGTSISLRAVSRTDTRVNRVRVMMAGDGRVEAKHMMRSLLFSITQIKPDVAPEEIARIIDGVTRAVKEGAIEVDTSWAKATMLHVPAAGSIWVEFTAK